MTHKRSDADTTTRGRNGYFLPLLTLILLLSPALGSAQISDTTPPSVVSLDLHPTTVDVTGAAQTVTVTMHLTDDLSGTMDACVTFVSPSGNQFHQTCLSPISGTPLDGIWQGSLQIPQFSESGAWSIGDGFASFVSDQVDNVLLLTAANLRAEGLPTDLTVISTPDTTPPQVTGIHFSASSIDVSAGAQTLTITLDLNDTPAGVWFSYAIFESPSGAQHQYISTVDFTLISGTTMNGTWQATHSFPRFSEAGTWHISKLYIGDIANNHEFLDTSDLTAQGLTTAFAVVSSPADTTPPTITGFDFSPKLIDTSVGSQNVTVTITVVDDLSGGNFSLETAGFESLPGVQFGSPSRGQLRRAPHYQLTAGTPLNGTWRAIVEFPQFSEAGTWNALSVQVNDTVDNVAYLNTEQLVTSGFPTDLIVVKPSLDVDGTVDAGGGTVLDQVFGARSTITFPAGALSGMTQVSIDVLESPVQVPIPTGFSGPGTFFVNVELSPAPNFPLPAPGVTVVLPLPQAMIPGAEIDLFRVEPTSGMLVAVLDTSGVPVMGTVDQGGLSATFMGVSHLSLFVGLIAGTIPTTSTTSITSTTTLQTTNTSNTTSTTTTTTTLPGAGSTTTLPGAGSTTTTTVPCTSVRCIVGAALQSAECAGQPIPASVVAKLKAAEDLLDQAATTQGKHARKLVRRAKQDFVKAEKQVMRLAHGKKGKVAPSCAQTIGGAVSGVVAGLGV